MAPIYKVSYVVAGEGHPGAILNQDHAPRVGEVVQFQARRFEVLEVIDLLPSRGDFRFLHATVRPLPPE